MNRLAGTILILFSTGALALTPVEPPMLKLEVTSGRLPPVQKRLPQPPLVVQVRNAPVTVQNVVTYDVVVAVANPDLALKPGMTATVTITTGHRDDVLRAPLRALSFNPAANGAASRTPRRSDEPVVWRLAADGSLERVAVDTGLRDDQFVEIEGGELAAGDQLVVAMKRAPDKPQGVRIPGQPRFR